MTDKIKNFLSHLHNFDEPPPVIEEEVAAEVDLPPPPPTFSEEELEEAKQRAFKDGVQQGLEDAKNTQNQSIQNALQSITPLIQTLLTQEAERGKHFESDVNMLLITVFEKVMPSLLQKIGLEELKKTISSILETDSAQKNIEIYCNSGELTAIQALIDEHPTLSSLKTTAKDHISPGSCEIGWTHGGALYSLPDVAEEITTILEQALEDNGIKRQNEAKDTKTLGEDCDTMEKAGSDNEIQEENTPAHDGD